MTCPLCHDKGWYWMPWGDIAGVEPPPPQKVACKHNVLKEKLVEEVRDQVYISPNFSLQREWGETPNGNNVAGRWVLRDKAGTWIDMDQYRYDLAERNGILLDS